MKLSLIATVSAFTVTDTRVARDIEEKGEKRYSQLHDMMFHYNSEFDEKKYWSYGCHCFVLGDRPMSDMGHGKPIDALDTVCKAYKDCQRCARKQFGSQCIGEQVKYKYGEKNGEKFCKDDANTCDRALCECDLAFAKNSAPVVSVWDEDYHAFWSKRPGGWDEKDYDNNCVNNPGSADMQCCTNSDKTTPYLWYNENNKQCCSDGSVKDDGASCF